MTPDHALQAPASCRAASSIEPDARSPKRLTRSRPATRRDRPPARSAEARSEPSRAFTAELSIPVARTRFVVIEYEPMDARKPALLHAPRWNASAAKVSSVARSSG